MSIDDRIRAGLTANADFPAPPVERHLEVVVRRHRRRLPLMVSVVLGAVAVLVVATWLAQASREGHPQPAAPIPPAEGAGTTLPEPLNGPGDPGLLPAGTYRYSLSRKEIRDGIVTWAPPRFAVANAGAWTWTLGGGRWSYELDLHAKETPVGFAGNTCEGYYDVHGSEVDFTTVTEYQVGDCASKTWKATWRQVDDGLLMDVTTDGRDLDFLFGAKTWERVGRPPSTPGRPGA